MAVEPGDTIGILGGGQLARMLALAAASLGLKVHIYAADPGSPAIDVVSAHTIADFRDEAALARFAASVAVVTYEFENVPAETAAFLHERVSVRPDAAALAASQDRLVEKEFINHLGIATAPFAQVDDAGALARAVAGIGRPSLLKTRRLGYDGKGQASVREGSDLAVVFRSLGGVPCILEGMVPFRCEVSVVGARTQAGDFRAYDVCENAHENHILSATTVPARIAAETQAGAFAIARAIADGLDYVGVLTVEMFVVEAARGGAEHLVVNEIAPRVHNSGHWTLDGAVTSQFEQHVRAICGWPLGATRRYGSIAMHNLIGAEALRWPELLAQDGTCLHLYGKREVRPGRKMGHFTRVLPEE